MPYRDHDERWILLAIVLTVVLGVGLAHCFASGCQNTCARFDDVGELHGGARVCLCRDDEGLLYEPRSRAR